LGENGAANPLCESGAAEVVVGSATAAIAKAAARTNARVTMVDLLFVHPVSNGGRQGACVNHLTLMKEETKKPRARARGFHANGRTRRSEAAVARTGLDRRGERGRERRKSDELLH
jgi:hypothetical protein